MNLKELTDEELYSLETRIYEERQRREEERNRRSESICFRCGPGEIYTEKYF